MTLLLLKPPLLLRVGKRVSGLNVVTAQFWTWGHQVQAIASISKTGLFGVSKERYELLLLLVCTKPDPRGSDAL